MELKRGLIAEFETPEQLVHAARELRKQGFRKMDAFTPYPLREVEEALELPRSRLGWIIFPVAMGAAAAAYLLQWWTSAVDYPLNVGARPAHAPPAFVPITFEMGVLAAAGSALLLLFYMARLPALWQPIFEVPGFERASIDRFFLAIDHSDPIFDREGTAAQLETLGAAHVRTLGLEEPPATEPEAASREERGEP